MDFADFPFEISAGVRSLAAEVETLFGAGVVVKKEDSGATEDDAPMRGGVDEWLPTVWLNSAKIEEVTEHGLAHELLHALRFAKGAPTMCSGRVDNVSIATFAEDVSDQIEHVAMWPTLEALGFEPRTLADSWFRRDTREMATRSVAPQQVGHAHVAIKAALCPMLCGDPEVVREHIRQAQVSAPGAAKVAPQIRRAVEWHGTDPKNARNLYREVLEIAGVPRKATMLKFLDVARRTERTFLAP